MLETPTAHSTLVIALIKIYIKTIRKTKLND